LNLRYNIREMNLNDTLLSHESAVQTWLDAAKRQVAAVQKLHKATVEGNLRDIEKLRTAAQTAAANASEAAANCTPVEFDSNAYLRPEGGFVEELTQAAENANVRLFERDGVIFSYPVLVRPEPELAAVRVDKTLFFSLRPSVLANLLKRLQAKDPKARPERFIETLLIAYELVRARDNYAAAVDVPLTSVYEVLTLLPGSEKDYTLLDFTRDLYFLDTSGVVETRKGYALSLPASTATREKKVKPLPFVDRQGREKLYATIKFLPPAGEGK
jgi:hypothetical protein